MCLWRRRRRRRGIPSHDFTLVGRGYTLVKVTLSRPHPLWVLRNSLCHVRVAVARRSVLPEDKVHGEGATGDLVGLGRV